MSTKSIAITTLLALYGLAAALTVLDAFYPIESVKAQPIPEREQNSRLIHALEDNTRALQENTRALQK